MKKKVDSGLIVYWSLIVSLGLLLLPGIGFASPKAAPQGLVYTFSPVPEGEHITHAFIVKNMGDAPLNILSVITP